MKWLLPVILACVVSAMGTQAQAQSRYDICAAYARDAMIGFYANSAVPVTMAERAWGMDREYARAVPASAARPIKPRGHCKAILRNAWRDRA